jgi:hypothetical protein
MMMLAARAVLALLAAYHLGTGLLGLIAPARARRLVRALYAADLRDAAQMDYVVAMIGAQAVAIGVLAGVATADPARNRAIVGGLALLQLLRAATRVARSRTLRDALGVPTRRNAIMIVALLLEVVILGASLT